MPLQRADLEQLVLAAPDDLEARLVYGDWLQAQGELHGAWVMLSHQLAAEPKDQRLRAAALEHLRVHGRKFLGSAAAHLPGFYLGWLGGFLDEVRMFGAPAIKQPAKVLAELLALPVARFLRTLSLGKFGDSDRPHVALLDVVAAARLPLLERLVLFDHPYRVCAKPIPLEAVWAAHPNLRRLGLHGFPVESVDWSRAPRALEELVLTRTRLDPDGFAKCGLANLRELSFVDSPEVDPQPLVKALVPLAQLRRLRAVGFRRVDELLAWLQSHEVLERLELLDVSGCERGGSLPARKGLRVLDLPGPLFDGFKAGQPTWLGARLAEEGRDSLATMPMAGVGLYNLSCYAIRDGALEAGVDAARAALTLPGSEFHAHAFGNLGVGLERKLELGETELVARDGLLRFPKNANLWSVLIDALRRQGRSDEAAAYLARAAKTITPAVRVEEAQSCLLDIVVTLSQRGAHRQAVDAAREKKFVRSDARLQCALAMALFALGKKGRARALLASRPVAAATASEGRGFVQHAQAVVLLANGRRREAVARLKQARDMAYPEWHFVARDPLLAALHDDAGFRGLVDARPSHKELR